MEKKDVEKATKALVVRMKKLTSAIPKDEKGLDLKEREGRLNMYSVLVQSLVEEFAKRYESGEGLGKLTTHGLLDTIVSLMKSIQEETKSLIDQPINSFSWTKKIKDGETLKLERKLPG